MLKKTIYILLIGLFACEKVVIVDLPDPQGLVVVEGWVTDTVSTHQIRLTRSNAFSANSDVLPIEDAQVIVQSRTGQIYSYSYSSNGYYEAETPYEGISGIEYRVRILVDTSEIRSDWDMMPEKVSIETLEISSFQENDPNNPNQQITIFFPKISSLDPDSNENYYRWVFFKNNEIFIEPESITIQNDRFFDGNLIPNNFQNFSYDPGEKITVELQSISSNTFNYLSLLKSQITTLGTSSGTTPAIVSGNLNYLDIENEHVLGFFGTRAISVESIDVP
ncbi:DUF4249 domain-containing protein [Ekhidna sp.]